MANLLNMLNQGIENLSTSPLGMAGLGLLSQPSGSFEPINPWEYAAKGMQMGMQNRRTQQEDKRKAEEYKLAIEEYNRKKLKYEEEKARKQQEQRALDAAMANLPPEQIPMARVLGKDFLKMQLENSMKPPQQTNLERNLIAAGLQPGTPAFQDAMMKGIMRPSVQIGAPEKPLSVSELSNLTVPSGEALRYGMTPAQAQQMGAIPRTPNDPIQQAEEIARRKQKLKEETASQGVPQALQGIYSARSQWAQNKTSPEAIARLNQERRRLAQILAAKRNPGRAPTDADVQIALQDIPDPLSIQQGLGSMMGEDPFAARMKVVEEELGAGKQGWQEVAPGVRIRRK